MDEMIKGGTFASYETYKEAFDAEVKRTELGFVVEARESLVD